MQLRKSRKVFLALGATALLFFAGFAIAENSSGNVANQTRRGQALVSQSVIVF